MNTTCRVLLVEDSEGDAELLLTELRRAGYDVASRRVETDVAMRSALEAGPWDLVLSDFRLPRFSAPAALDVLKLARIDIPFIIVSGAVGEETAVESLNAGAHDFIMKGNLSRLGPAVERQFRDVEARRARARAEKALRESEERYRLVAEHAVDFILTMDDDGRIEYTNPAAERVFGFTSLEMAGKPLALLMPERLTPCHHVALRRHRAGEDGFDIWGGHEPVGVHRTGREVPLETSCAGFRRDGRNCVVIVGRDITERRAEETRREQLYSEAQRARLEAEAARAEAEQANRAKSDFVDMLSHELRTPLAAIIGYAAILDEGIVGPLSSEQREQIRRIEVNSQHLLKLIETLLDFGAIEARRVHCAITTVHLRDVLSACDVMIAPLALEKGLVYAAQTCDPALAVRGDATKLQQVLINLLSNAIKFTDPGGRISVSCTGEPLAVRLRVSDTGCGVPVDKVEDIFKPFVQAAPVLTRKHGGVGLGLAISRELARNMGGDVVLESTGSAGSVFTLSLPRADASGSHLSLLAPAIVADGSVPADTLRRDGRTARAAGER